MQSKEIKETMGEGWEEPIPCRLEIKEVQLEVIGNEVGNKDQRHILEGP